MKNKITIGLPVYNGEKLIEECLNSLLSQTYTNFELIISDNGSTDNTEFICRKYCLLDSRISYIRHNENRGGLANFQGLLDAASGVYFMWAAYDDLWSYNYLEEAVSLLKNVDFDFVLPSFDLVSIRYKVRAHRNMNIFKFIGEDDSNVRVLSFMELHPSSHKCNIVYSLFRTEFLRRAILRLNGVPNDGLLGAIILDLGRGLISKNSVFSKRYFNFWPGALDFLRRYIADKQPTDFNGFKSRGEVEAIEIFPHLESQIRFIGRKYQPYKYTKNFKIY